MFSLLLLPTPPQGDDSSGWISMKSGSLSSVALRNDGNAFSLARRHAKAESGRKLRHMRESSNELLSISSIQPNSVVVRESQQIVAQFTLLLQVYRSPVPRDGNHKKLKAGGENNIIRDYFPFKCWLFTARQKQQGFFPNCPWIIDFLLLLSFCCFVAGSCSGEHRIITERL